LYKQYPFGKHLILLNLVIKIIKNMYDAYLITGGTGFIGKRLSKHLLNLNKPVIVISRNKPTTTIPGITYIQWHIQNKTLSASIAYNNICVFHLAGAGVADKRWNNARKQEISNSRTESTTCLQHLIATKQINASYLVSASAIGYYATSNNAITENDKPATDFLGSTCVAWEQSIATITNIPIPSTILRIGLVMGAGGGAIKEFVNTMKFKIAGIPGNGKQLYSWIHIDDLVSIMEYTAHNNTQGIYNAVAPEVVSCKTLITTLAKHYCGWYIPAPAPSFVIKLMLGEMSIEVLKSANISCKKIIDAGFKFAYPKVDMAMQQIANEAKEN
jgi:uncharacterized protein